MSVSRFGARGFSRRAVLAGGASGLALLAAGAGASAQGAPKKGGRLRIGVPGGAATHTLDPGTFNETYMTLVGFGGLRNNLTEISSDNKVVPELAESWEASKDAKTWTFKIRSGVQFHSGKSLTANDVKVSFDHHRGANTTSVAKGIMSGIEEVTVLDPSTVRIVMKLGNADLPALLTDYHLGIMPANADGTPDWKSGDGTGGYKLSKFEPGIRTFMTRNPNYWKAGRAHFDEIEVVNVPDVSARQNALISGELDVVDRIDLKTIDLLKRNPNLVVENVPGRLYYTYEMMTTAEPFTDNNVRLAVKHAMNRKALLDTILFGYGSIGNDNPISKAYTYYDGSIPQHSYDIDKAKFYLKKAGKSSISFDVPVSDISFNGATDSAVLFKEQAAAAGININVIRSPADGYFSNVWGKAPFSISYFTGRPTEDGILSISYLKNAGMNSVKWDKPRVDELVVAARAELDTNKRRQQYSEIQRIITEEGGYLIPLFADYVWARSKKLAHGPSLSSERTMDGAKLIERWWFA